MSFAVLFLHQVLNMVYAWASDGLIIKTGKTDFEPQKSTALQRFALFAQVMSQHRPKVFKCEMIYKEGIHGSQSISRKGILV